MGNASTADADFDLARITFRAKGPLTSVGFPTEVVFLVFSGDETQVSKSGQLLLKNTSDFTGAFIEVTGVGITPPNLVQPASGDVTNDNTPFFEWTPSTGGVVDYLLQVTSGGTFNPHLDIDVLISGDTTQFQTPIGDSLNDAVYQWRVVARDAAQNTASSVTRTFTVDTTPPFPPVLVEPVEGAFIPISNVFFDWDPSTGDVTSYRLLVTSGDINAGPFQIDQLILHPTTQFTGDLGGDGVCQWRVIARDAAQNTASSVTRTFTISTAAPPTPPNLVRPASGDLINDDTPFFEWTLSAGNVFDYLLQVTSADITAGPFDIDVVIPHPGTGHQTVAPLNDATYRWRVRARDEAGVNPATSETRIFTISTAVAQPPSAPSLVQPASGDLTNDVTPFFEWSPSSGNVFDYLLQVTSADTFNPHLDLEVVVAHPGTGHQTATPLNDATYRWRVIARDQGAVNTAFSETRTFTISTPRLIAETSLRQALDSDGVAVLEIRVDSVVDKTGDAVVLSGWVGTYEAELTFDNSCMTPLDVRGAGPFVAPQDNIVGNRLLITAAQFTAAPQPPLTLAKVALRLTGDAVTQCGITLTRLVIFEALAIEEEEIPQGNTPSRSFLKGDASGNGVVSSFDALIILQFVIGIPLRSPAGDEPGKVSPNPPKDGLGDSP